MERSEEYKLDLLHGSIQTILQDSNIFTMSNHAAKASSARLLCMYFVLFFVCLFFFFSLYLFEDLLEDRPLQAEGAFLHKLTKKKNTTYLIITLGLLKLLLVESSY